MQQDQAEGLGLEQALGVLRRRLPLVLLCVVIVAGVAFGYSKHETKKYTATASLDFSQNSLSQQIAGLPASSSSTLLAQQASNVELVKLGDMAAVTAATLGHGLTAEKIAGNLSVAEQGESNVVEVSATSTSPKLAAAIANTYSRQFVSEQQKTNHLYFASALALVNKQLAALSRQQRVGGAGVALEDREQTLSFLEALHYGNVDVAQEAAVPTNPSSPNPPKDTALGGFVGLIVGLGLALMLERTDRRIRRPQDLEAAYGLPLLGAVPNSRALARSAVGGGMHSILPSSEAEAFSLIRAHLRLLTIDRDLRTVLIASAAPGDGKTTIARHLAEAAARSGSRVLLLEVDLRDPTFSQQLGLRVGPGLTEVVNGSASVDEAVQRVVLNAGPGEEGAKVQTLAVLAAGSILPPNPGELIESDAMDAVLDQVRPSYDLIVIDTPPLTAVSDAFPLLTKVDGVIIVGRVGLSRRNAAEQLHSILASSGAPLLGIIANGSESGIPGVYAAPNDGKSSRTAASKRGASPSEDPIPTTKV